MKIKFTCKRGFEREFNCADDTEEPKFIPDFMVYNTDHELLKNGFFSECVACGECDEKSNFLSFDENDDLIQDENGSPVFGVGKSCGVHVKIWNYEP